MQVLYDDDDLLVLSKPSGLLSVPGRPEDHKDSLQTRAAAEYKGALLVHRLDHDTSGVFLMAMNKRAQANLGLQFEERKTEKSYIARVWGHIEGERGQVDLPLCVDWVNRPRQMVCYENGRPAQTDWEVIERGELPDGAPFTRVKLTPITGRSHQLRVHMAEMGFPILGEPFYAPEEAEKAADRLQLHAESLTIRHPTSGEMMTFIDPCPF